VRIKISFAERPTVPRRIRGFVFGPAKAGHYVQEKGRLKAAPTYSVRLKPDTTTAAARERRSGAKLWALCFFRSVLIGADAEVRGSRSVLRSDLRSRAAFVASCLVRLKPDTTYKKRAA